MKRTKYLALGGLLLAAVPVWVQATVATDAAPGTTTAVTSAAPEATSDVSATLATQPESQAAALPVAQTVLTQAQTLMVGGANQLARTQLLDFLKTNPAPALAAAARFEAAQCLFNQGDNDGYRQEARPLLDQLESLTPDLRAQLKYHLAMADFRQGHWAEARTGLDQLLAAGVAGTSVDGWAQVHAAECRLELNDEAGFRQIADPFLQRQPAPPAECLARMGLDLARLPLRHGQVAEARAALQAFAQAHAGTPYADQALTLAAECLYDAGDFAAYRQEATTFLQQHPQAAVADRNELSFRLARVDLNLGHWDEAHQALREFAAAHPDAPQTLTALAEAAQCLFNKHDLDGFKQEAEALLARPEAAAPGQVPGLKYHLAMVPAVKGQWAEAAAKLGEFIAQPGGDLQMRMVAGLQRGMALHRQAAAARQENKASEAEALEQQSAAQLADLRTSATQVIKTHPDHGLRRLAAAWLMESWQEVSDPPTLAQKAQELVGQTQAPTLEWGMAMVWLGIARTQQNPTDWTGAAQAFDAVLAAGMKDDNLPDHIPTNAAYWRAAVAEAQGETTTTQAMVAKIKTEMPDGPVKAGALARFEPALAAVEAGQ